MIKAVVFGSERNAMLFARSRGIDPKDVVMSTQPDKVKDFDGETIISVRYSPEVWKPATFACEKRTKETADILADLQSTGVIVEEVKL